MTATARDGGAERPEVVDPRIVRSRVAIVAAATEHFLDRGYLAANLDEIAAEAGVSKRTIYNIYGGKEALFRAILTEALQTAERFAGEVVPALGTTDDIRSELTRTALELAHAVLGGRIVRLRRLLIAEAGRIPELAREYYERAPQRVMDAIADGLCRYGDRLRIDDPRMAAEQFAFLAIGASLDRALFDPDGEAASVELIEQRAIHGVDVFLRAYSNRDPS